MKSMGFCKLFSMVTAVILGLFPIGGTANAQVSTNNYKQTNLVADTATVTPAPAHVDANLVNPWGIAFFPGGPFWVSDNNSGFSTLYDQNGVRQGTFTVPPPAGSTLAATPTGIVANVSRTGFIVGGLPSLFIFDTEDGTISGWNGGANVILVVDNSMGGTGAVYKGLTMIANNGANFLLATNFRSGNVEVYDSNFQTAHLSGTFTDPNLPAGYAPFGIHNLGNNKIFVTYAVQDAAKHDPIHAAGDGIVDIFDNNGNFVQRFISNGDMHTNAPWGVVVPPAGFGAFGGDFLIGNFGDGVLNVYSPAGIFMDSVRDAGGNVITNLSLWDLVFGGGGAAGDPNTLYFTAGGMNEAQGIFASLVPTQASGGNTPNFSVSASPSSATVDAGNSSNFTINVNPTNGFNSALTFSCSGLPTGAKCSFSTQSYMPGGTTLPMLTIKTTPRNGMKALVPVSGPASSSGLTSKVQILLALGFVGLVLVCLYREKFESRLGFSTVLRAGSLAVVLLLLFAAAGCGSGNSSAAGTPAGTSTVTVTGTSGTLSQSTTITLKVN